MKKSVGGGEKLNGDVMVVGSGIAAMQAAVSLASLGHHVVMVFSGKGLGGAAAARPELLGHVGCDSAVSAGEVRRVVAELEQKLKASGNVRLCPDSFVKRVQGEVGSFSVTVQSVGGRETVPASAIVLATGLATVQAPDVAGAQAPQKVVDVREAARVVAAGAVPRRVAIVMDVKSEQGREVSAEVLSLAELMAKKSGAQVKIFCNSIRVAATGMETLYRRARAAGVVISRHSRRPAISTANDTVSVSADDVVADIAISEEFDLLVVADRAITAEAKAFAGVFRGLRTGPGGGLQADNVWLLPTETNLAGIYVAGSARGNSDYREALTDGQAVAGRIHELTCRGGLERSGEAAQVDADKCVLCLTCRRVCPHGAVAVDSVKKAAQVSEAACRRCGSCAVECPAKAITLPGFTNEQVADEVGAQPGLAVFACENSALVAAGAAMKALPAGVRLVKVPCAGKVDHSSVLAALEQGAARVLILGCHTESCRYISGATRAKKRMERISSMLSRAGYDGSRVVFGGIAPVEPGRFRKYLGIN